VPPPVSAADVDVVAARYTDRAADAARRLGVRVEDVTPLLARAAADAIDAAATPPYPLADQDAVTGRWFREVRTAAARDRSLRALPPRRGLDPREARLEDALAGLDERRMLALLFRDSYDLPWPAVATALGLSEGDAATVVAEARVRLLDALGEDSGDPLSGHPSIAGVGFGTLGRLADGQPEADDPQLPVRQRHVEGCATCSSFIDAQQRAHRALAGLAVRGLSEADREEVIEQVGARAASVLPATLAGAVVIRTATEPRERPPLLLLLGIGALLALLLGIGLGALLSRKHAPANRQAVVTPLLTTAPPFATDPPKPSPTASSALPTPSALPSPTPIATAAPTPSPTPSPTPRARPTATTAAPTTSAAAPVVTTVAPSSTAAAPTTTAAPSTSAAATPALTLAPSSGPSLQMITVSGTGFTPTKDVTVTYGQAAVGAQATNTATVGSDGSFTTTVQASGAPGQHTVSAMDTGGASTSASFTQTS